VSGYNADVVVEASSTKPDVLSGVTTAAMEDGTGNVGNTWYERGYYPPTPETGLPPAGCEVASTTASDHRYLLASSYEGNNAVLLDAAHPEATVTPATPAPYAALSFLTSAGHGPATNRCIVDHQDGSSQTNTIISPDWLDTAPMALCGNGRVKLGNRLVETQDPGYPRLYAVDFAIQNTASPVKEIHLTFLGGPLNSHAAVFALSGVPASTLPPVLQPSTLSISTGADGAWILSSSVQGRLQSTTALKGKNTLWKEEGLISQPIRLTPASNEPTKFFRVLSQ
jgi:hypothetical protein